MVWGPGPFAAEVTEKVSTSVASVLTYWTLSGPLPEQADAGDATLVTLAVPTVPERVR